MDVKDPYVSIVKTIRNEGAAYNPPSIDIGVVMSTDPLIVNVGDLPLTKDNLLISTFLLKDYKRKFSLDSTSATGSTTSGSITSIGIPSGELVCEGELKKDDIVVCLATKDRQTYVVLVKVQKP